MQKWRAFEDPGIVIFYFAQHLESVDTPLEPPGESWKGEEGGLRLKLSDERRQFPGRLSSYLPTQNQAFETH